MLVKKKNPNWAPIENKELKVGETIDITDPRNLIINGDVVAVGERGVEISAFELYGVVVKDEMSEFQDYMKLKKAEAEKAALDKEKEELEAELAKPKEEVKEEVKLEAPVVEKKEEVKEEAKEEALEAPAAPEFKISDLGKTTKAK